LLKKLITLKKARLYGADIDSIDIADMTKSDVNALWLLLITPPVVGLEWFRRWKAERKL